MTRQAKIALPSHDVSEYVRLVDFIKNIFVSTYFERRALDRTEAKCVAAAVVPTTSTAAKSLTECVELARCNE